MSPEERRAAENRTKVENLCGLYPHVEADQISDIFQACNNNIQIAAAQISAIFGDAPNSNQNSPREFEEPVEV